MAKTIVDTKLVNTDVGLAIIKAFRITNKRAGEAKCKGPEGHEEYLQYCGHIRDLIAKAEDAGFEIWVNPNGQTGHTYDKDYKESPDELHDFERHQAEVAAVLQQCHDEQEENFDASSDPEED